MQLEKCRCSSADHRLFNVHTLGVQTGTSRCERWLSRRTRRWSKATRNRSDRFSWPSRIDSFGRCLTSTGCGPVRVRDDGCACFRRRTRRARWCSSSSTSIGGSSRWPADAARRAVRRAIATAISGCCTKNVNSCTLFVRLSELLCLAFAHHLSFFMRSSGNLTCCFFLEFSWSVGVSSGGVWVC